MRNKAAEPVFVRLQIPFQNVPHRSPGAIHSFQKEKTQGKVLSY
jgi:hypothetical protein